MLQLTLIRHAKSSWADPSLVDFDRPLNARGFRDAPMMGEILKKQLAPIDRLLSSPALRAITTSELISKKLAYPVERIALEPQLYDASLQAQCEVINTFDDTIRHYALVAHNPGVSELAGYLGDGQLDDLPTCAVVSLTFEPDTWQAVGRGGGQLVLFEYPKKHK